MRTSDTGFVMHRGVIARSMVWVRLMQFFNVLFGVAYVLFGARFVLAYVRANENTGFMQFLHRATDPVYRPFRNVLPVSQDPGGHPLVWSLLLTIVVLAIAHAGIRALLRMAARPPHPEEEF